MKNTDIEAIYTELRVPTHIQGHMKQVRNVAKQLVDAHEAIGVPVDADSVLNAALLHDAMKMCEIDHGSIEGATPEDIEVWKNITEKYCQVNHDQAMGKFLDERGESQIAQLIHKNTFATVLTGFSNLEEKLLYYADKRVKHDEIVSLEERLRDGRERYVKNEAELERTKEIEKALYVLEKELFQNLNIVPGDIA